MVGLDLFTVPVVLLRLYLDFFAVLDAAGFAPPKEKRGLEATGFFATGFFATGFFATGFFTTGFFAGGFFAKGFTAAFFVPGAAGFFLPKSASVGCDRGREGVSERPTNVHVRIFSAISSGNSRAARGDANDG